MSNPIQKARTHPDLHVVHSIPGRLRLRARNLYGRPRSADHLVRKLSAIQGVHHVEANPNTGSVTMHYHHSATASVAFFAEIAGVLGLVAEGIDPSAVEGLFELVGGSPVEIAKSLDHQHIVVPLASFVLGVLIGRQLI